jgi:hypothetical protein
MTRQEHLLSIAAEECNELAKELHKALRFGLDDHYPEHPMTNRERIEAEFTDLFTLVQMLHREGLINATISQERCMEKINKVEKYLKYSKEVGTLTE